MKQNQVLRIVICTNQDEWAAAKKFRQIYFFDKVPIKDPYEWTFNHKDHVHFMLYNDTNMVGYAHIQLWPKSRATIRIIVVDKKEQNQGFGKQFLAWIETWLKTKNYRSVQTQSSPEVVAFYNKQGYTKMPFNDPDGFDEDPRDTPMGKQLKSN